MNKEDTKYEVVNEEIFDMGYFAANRGYPEFECPFPADARRAKDWLAGHAVASNWRRY